jgi:hypothetical protein
VVNDHGERDNDSGDVSEKDGNSEGTVVNKVDESNEENLEEDDAGDFRDLEVEIQLVQEQMAELKQRSDVLKRARRGGERL